MSLFIGFLTFILVVDCFVLILLILIQLPKKEAGAGVAFGGGATDALFGAGSGNALTNMTKYASAIFIGLALCLSLLNSHQAQSGKLRLREALEKKMAAPAPLIPAAAPANANQSSATPPQNPQSAPAVTATNLTNTATTNLSVSLATTNVAATAQTQATANARPAATNQANTNAPATPAKP